MGNNRRRIARILEPDDVFWVFRYFSKIFTLVKAILHEKTTLIFSWRPRVNKSSTSLRLLACSIRSSNTINLLPWRFETKSVRSSDGNPLTNSILFKFWLSSLKTSFRSVGENQNIQSISGVTNRSFLNNNVLVKKVFPLLRPPVRIIENGWLMGSSCTFTVSMSNV